MKQKSKNTISKPKFRFVVTIHKYKGNSYKSHSKELTKKQVLYYLKRTFGAYAYVGRERNKEGIWINPTIDNKFAIENWINGKLISIILTNDFEKALNRIKRRFNGDIIKVKISQIVSNPTPWAKKYKYKSYSGD